MSGGLPNFSPFPFARLRRVSRREAALESALARWVAARPAGGERLARLAGGRVRIAVASVRAAGGGAGGGPGGGAGAGGGGGAGIDPHAAVAEVRIGGASVLVAAAAGPVRALAQRLLGGPAELAAPRPLGAVEQAIWALAVAAALEDAGIAGEVWPLAELPPPGDAGAAGGPGAARVELAVSLPGGPLTVVALVPADAALALRAPPPRPAPAWPIGLPVVVARCAIPRAALAGLAPRDVITVEGGLALAIGAGEVGLRAAPGAIEAEVATGYVRRAMALPDEAHLELTVELGTTQVPLRRLAELAVGEIIPLGRPLAGPYDVRAAGRLVGRGELVDVDGELGVRIVSLFSRSGEE